MFAQSDYAPTASDEEVTRANGMINQSLEEIVLEQPHLFRKRTTVFPFAPIEGDVEDPTDRMNVVNTALEQLGYIWELQAAVQPVWPTGTDEWSWNMKVQATSAYDGQVHERLIREMWTVGGKIRLSLSAPWPKVDETNLEYKIYQPFIWLPPDLVQIESAFAWPSGTGVASWAGYGPAEFMAGRWTAVGRADVFNEYGIDFQIGPTFTPPPPENAPDVQLVGEQGGHPWDGPDPAGELEYILTLCMGRRPVDTYSGKGFREPLFESHPSPASTSIVVAFGGPGVQINLPNMDWMLNFYPGLPTIFAPDRDTRAGTFWRIYRRRKTATIDNPPTNLVLPTMVFTPDAFELLAEVQTHETVFYDQGHDITDKTVRLKPHQSYRSILLTQPVADDLRIEVVGIVAPPPLVHDTDVAEIPIEAMPLLVAKCLRYWAAHIGDRDLVNDAKEDARAASDVISQTFGTLVDGIRRKENPRRRFPRR